MDVCKSRATGFDMVRRTRAEAAVTREQLLDAAERVFRSKGVTRTSLAEVASAAGVTRGAVYWHFRDKADLFRALVDRATLPLEIMIERATAGDADDPLARIRALAIAALTGLAADPRSRAVLEVVFHKSELTAELECIADLRRKQRSECMSQVEGLFRQALDAGQLPRDTDPSLATRALHAYVTGILHEWVLDVRAFDLARDAPALVDTFMTGLRANPPRRSSTRAPAARARARAN
jgi:TetR/AcrR family acrAB operon transcriptional repressor